jgi:glycosyltransferase involved in cell wall biosynthesis
MLSMHPTIRVHTFHGHLLYGYFTPLKRRLIIIAEQFLAVHTHHLLAVGDKVRQDLLFEGIGRVERFGLMPPGLEIDKLPIKQISQESYNLSTTKLQCAFIGRVTQIKRPDRFLDVVSRIMENGVQIEFFMAGDGDLLEVCRERIERENLPVKVLGWQNNIAKVLAAADIVILTSDNEGTPLSLIQAGMVGLPVVTTRVGSVPEVVLDGRTGIITSTDVEEISNALEELAHNPDLRAQMGAAAKEFTLANFGVTRLVRDHEQLYKKLIKERNYL